MSPLYVALVSPVIKLEWFKYGQPVNALDGEVRDRFHPVGINSQVSGVIAVTTILPRRFSRGAQIPPVVKSDDQQGKIANPAYRDAELEQILFFDLSYAMDPELDLRRPDLWDESKSLIQLLIPARNTPFPK